MTAVLKYLRASRVTSSPDVDRIAAWFGLSDWAAVIEKRCTPIHGQAGSVEFDVSHRQLTIGINPADWLRAYIVCHEFAHVLLALLGFEVSDNEDFEEAACNFLALRAVEALALPEWLEVAA